MDLREDMRKKKNLKDVLRKPSASYNVHGLPKNVEETSTKLKVFWLAFFMLTFIGAIIHISFMVRTYFSYPVAEVTNSKEGIPIEFPSVTICNINAIQLVKLNTLLSTDEGNEILDWFTFSAQFENDSFATQIGSFQAFYENLPHAALQMGQDIEDSVLFCKFNNMDCGPANFSIFFDSANYYNCFTFNSGYNSINRTLNEEKLVAKSTGVLSGLSLILSLNIERPPPGSFRIYNEGDIAKFSAGARVQIHPSGTMPSPINQGFDVPPGFSTNVGVEAVKYLRLKQPHGDCTSEKLKITREYRNAVSTCLQICKQNILQLKCGCKSSGFMLLHEANVLDNNTDYCGSIKEFRNWTYVDKAKANLSAMECQQNVLNDFQENGIDEKACGCSQPCTELAYKTSLSTSYWPLEFYQYTLLNGLFKNRTIPSAQLKEALDLLNATTNKRIENAMEGEFENYSQADINDQVRASTIIRENLIRLNIYVDNLRTTEYTKVPTYNVSDLLADVGGTIGLWLGISFLTIMQFIELRKLASYFLKHKQTNAEEEKNDDGHNQVIL